jgi:hypothetical protein
MYDDFIQNVSWESCSETSTSINGKYMGVVQTGGRCNWLKIISSGGLWYWQCWNFVCVATELIGYLIVSDAKLLHSCMLRCPKFNLRAVEYEVEVLSL